MAKTDYSVPFHSSQRAAVCRAPFHGTHRNLCYCVDFGVPEGTPVLAARDGVVVVRESRYALSYDDPRFMGRANIIVVRHDDGEESVYAHLQWRSVVVRVGQCVRRGQRIAKSGRTGYAGYPHLHFGVYDARGRNIPVRFRKPPVRCR